MTKPHQVCNQLVTLLDIYPTLLELCGLPNPPQPLNGKSLVPLLKDPNHEWDNKVVSGYTLKEGGAGASDVYLCVRTKDYRYTNYGDGTEEFYDCTKDPHEWTNLAGNPEYKQRIEQHKAMLPIPATPMGSKKSSKKGDDDQPQKKSDKKEKTGKE
ncbi:MAG: DUF4976 domain-containing protein [Bdellovibrionaceae bacterium]|nr:DUF4976 domain-containing protein [Pseudobdellovibrionaceae bacterium]